MQATLTTPSTAPNGRRRDFRTEFDAFSTLSVASLRELPMRWEERKVFLEDRTQDCGFDRHYIYHTAWAARVLAQMRPAKHVDVSSSLYFSAIASAFVPIEVYEYRPVKLELPNLVAGTADLLALPFADRSIQSISCMHVVEHIGLGRYGDPLDPDGDLKGMRELRRVTAPGGTLLFVCPIGRARIVFNAHRIYSFDQVVSYFPGMKLRSFSLIPDGRFDQGLVENPPKEFVDQQNYGCGCFWFAREGR